MSDSNISEDFEEDEEVKSHDSLEELKLQLEQRRKNDPNYVPNPEEEEEKERERQQNEEKQKKKEQLKKQTETKKKKQEEEKIKKEKEKEEEDEYGQDDFAEEEVVEENFELQSNSFKSIHSQQNKEDDNLAYTLKKQSRSYMSDVQKSQSSIKSEKQSNASIRPASAAINKASKGTAAAPNKVSQPTKPVSQLSKGTSNQPKTASNQPKIAPAATKPQQQKLAPVSTPQRVASAKTSSENQIKTPAIQKKVGATAHADEQAKKRKEIEDRENKLQKKPKLPDIQQKTLQVNNFMKAANAAGKAANAAGKLLKGNDNKNQKEQNKIVVKEELEGDIFGEEEVEKGDQNAAPMEEDEEELAKAEEKKKRQQILKEQKEKRDHQGEEQDENVKIILERHKQKEEELRKKEDELYAIERIEKMKQKRAKQNLQYENEESNWVDVTRKNVITLQKEEREKQQDKFRDIMIKNLKKEEEEMKKTKVEGQGKVNNKMEQAEKKYDVNVAGKKGTKNETSKIEKEKDEVIRENDMVREMKKREHQKYLDQLEIEKKLRRQAKEFVNEGQGNLKKGNRALDEIMGGKQSKPQEIKKEKKRDFGYEEEQKEKQEREEIEIRQLKVKLKQVTDENKQIKSAMQSQKDIYAKNQDYISQIKNADGVVVLGDNKFTSFGLVPALDKKKKDEETSTTDEESIGMLDKMNDDEKRYMTQPTVIELIINKITDQGLSLSDIFQLLDFNKDGILTVQEIQLNMGKLDLNLNEEEIGEIIKVVDINGDGVINEFEFVKNLETEYQSQKEYQRVMGDLKEIQNPIVLSERVLDLEIRQKIVVKLTKKEEDLEESKGPDYEKVLKALKKQEDAFEKRQKLRKRGKDLTELTSKATTLKVEQRKLEDEKEKFNIMQKERMEAIKQNIDKLTEELIKVSEASIIAKNEMEKQKNEYQKLVLKQVAIDRLQEQINQGKSDKETEIQKQMGKYQTNMKQKAKNVQFQQQQIMQFQSTIGAAILLQKIYRGWKARAQAKKKKQAVLRAIAFISSYLWWSQKKRKARKVVRLALKLKDKRLIFAFKLLDVLSKHANKEMANIKSLATLKQQMPAQEFNAMMIKQNEIKHRQLKQIKQPLDVDPQEDTFEQEEIDQGLNSSGANIPLYSKTNKQGQQTSEQFKVADLPAIMTLQRGYRTWKKKISFDSQNEVVFCMGGINPICRFCNEKKVEILCRTCEQCIFCAECYSKFHKAYQRKNHRFYELNEAAYSKFEHVSESKVLEYKEDIYKAIKDQFNDMKKKFSQTDQNTGLVTLQFAFEYIEKIPALVANHDLLEKTKQLVSRFIVTDSEAFKGFQSQKIEQKYDSKKQYIDHSKFIRSFAKYTN